MTDVATEGTNIWRITNTVCDFPKLAEGTVAGRA